jgi:16S rRNA (cytidine1402-2'-O)-methyltransferase
VSSKAGELYIVATPIGNLKDMTYRAVEVLQQVDLILVEDTRNAIKLLQHYGIRRPMKALHDHNEELLTADLVQKLKQGSNMALISDAGTPLVSDPGFRLVRAAQKAGIQALTVPGACAAVAALSIAGLPTDRFVFEGFLPAKTAAREQRLLEVKHESRTLVFYEAKHRIVAFLRSMQKIFGDRRNAVVARELTKKFESVYQGELQDVVTQIVSDEQAQKGEYVVIVEGVKTDGEEIDLDNVLQALLSELGVSKVSKVAAKITGVSKNQCYQRALELSKGT